MYHIVLLCNAISILGASKADSSHASAGVSHIADQGQLPRQAAQVLSDIAFICTGVLQSTVTTGCYAS